MNLTLLTGGIFYASKEEPWFLELLRLRLLSNWSTENISDVHREKASNNLNNWGYEIEDGGKTTAPFLPRNPDLLIQGFDTTRTSRLTNKLLINIEPIYVGLYVHTVRFGYHNVLWS